MRLLTSRTRGLPTGPVSDATLAKLYAFPKAHWVRANFVSTLDGSAQGPDGLSGTINTSADKRVFSANRRLADCVMVGAGTARAENYRPAQIPLVIVSRRGRLPESLRESRNRVVLATCASSRRKATDDAWLCGDDEVDLAAVVARCAAEGMPRILTEGGPHLFGDLLTDGLVDDIALTTSPKAVGGSHLRVVEATGDLDVDADLRHLLEEDGTLIALWRLRK